MAWSVYEDHAFPHRREIAYRIQLATRFRFYSSTSMGCFLTNLNVAGAKMRNLNWLSIFEMLPNSNWNSPKCRRRRLQLPVAAEVLEHRLCLSAAPVMSSLTLNNDTGEAGDNITEDASVSGTVTNDGSTSGIEVEIDLNGDGIADDWAFADGNGNFVYNPAGYVGYGEVTIQARAVVLDEVTMEYLYSGWSSVSFTYNNPNDPAQITSLSLQTDTGEAGDNITENPTLVGTVTNDGSTSGIDVEIDLNGDGISDDWAFADANGNFVYNPEGYIGYGEVTIQARAVELDDVTMEYLYGDWVSISFTYNNPNRPAQVTSLSLQSDTGQPGDGITENPTLVGTVTNDGSTNGIEVEIDLNGDGMADDWAFADANGNFQYDPSSTSSASGDMTIQVRAVKLDEVTMEYLYGDWVSISFTYVNSYSY